LEKSLNVEKVLKEKELKKKKTTTLSHPSLSA
jgi:hypothetical protein